MNVKVRGSILGQNGAPLEARRELARWLPARGAALYGSPPLSRQQAGQHPSATLATAPMSLRETWGPPIGPQAEAGVASGADRPAKRAELEIYLRSPFDLMVDRSDHGREDSNLGMPESAECPRSPMAGAAECLTRDDCCWPGSSRNG